MRDIRDLFFLRRVFWGWLNIRAFVKMSLVLVGMLLVASMATACGGSSGSLPDISISVYQGQDVLGGETVDLHKLMKSGKPVVLNMWAGLCPPCRAEMPDLQQVYDTYKGQVLLVGLDVGPYVGLGTRDDAKKLLTDLKITYPVGTTYDSKVIEQYNIQAMPTTFFIEPDGKVYQKWVGLLTHDKIVQLFQGLVSVSKGK